MKKDRALFVAGLIFALIAIIHLLRFLFKTEIMVGGHVISMELSLVGFVIAGLLSIWMFMAKGSRG
jgi:hypothetical protein